MRGNPLVELVAILVMLVAILVGGGYWLVNKQEQPDKENEQKVLQAPKKEAKINPVTFETAVKTTK